MTDADAQTIEADDGSGMPLSLPEKAGDRALLVALLGSLALHLLPFVALVGAAFFDSGGGGASDDEHRLGDEKGKLDGVNVEIIDAREYDRRYMSHTDGQGAGNENAPPSQPAENKPVPPEPKPEPKPEQQQASAAEAIPPEPKPEAEGGLTRQEAEQLINSAVSDFQHVVEATSKASLAAYGSASPAIRAILRKLKSMMPKSPGVRGSVVVRIVLSDHGGVAAAGIMQSSGKPELDKRVLDSVRTALKPDPATNLAPKERLLQITYEYF